MFIKSAIGSALLSLAVLAATPVFAADSDPSIHQVYEAAQAGRFSDAQAMMDKVLRDHPNSAKAHYIEADLLAKQNRLREAQTELNSAERLDPTLKFAKPQALQELKSVIAGPTRVVQRPQPVYAQPTYTRPVTVYQQPVVTRAPASSSGSGLLTVVIIVGLIFLFFFIVRALGRRNTVIAGGGGYPAGYGPGGSYGPGGGYGPGGMVVNQGGMGSGILGGLATGAAVGAGIVAGEELMHHFTDRERTETVYENPPQNDSWSQPNDDMGGNDFGVSDSSSWDSGGGGGGGGSDDWN